MSPTLRPAQNPAASPVRPVTRIGFSGTKREAKDCPHWRLPPLLWLLLPLHGMPPEPPPPGGSTVAAGGDGGPLGAALPGAGLRSDGGSSVAVVWHRCAHRNVQAGQGLPRVARTAMLSGRLIARLAERSHRAARFMAASCSLHLRNGTTRAPHLQTGVFVLELQTVPLNESTAQSSRTPAVFKLGQRSTGCPHLFSHFEVARGHFEGARVR